MQEKASKYTDIIDVGIGNLPVGKLVITPDNLCAFEYDIEYIKNGTSISPFYLPLKQGVFISKRDPFNGIFGVFNDSLPDGWGLLLIDRYLMKLGINPATLTHLDRLSLVGNKGMGALTYKPGNSIQSSEDISDINKLATEIRKILNNNFSGSLEVLLNKSGSSAGARPKVLIKDGRKEWLVKFRSANDPADIGNIEYKYSKVAKKCGIEMPETKLFKDKYFGVCRFDSTGSKRIHIHSASGLLYASYRFPSLDYTELLKATYALTINTEEVGKMFRQMVFNVLTHNRDDHAKNFSFMLKDDAWYLSPAYDLVYSKGFNGFHTTTVAGNGNPTKEDIFTVAKNTGFSMKKARLIFDEVYEGCKEIRVKNWK